MDFLSVLKNNPIFSHLNAAELQILIDSALHEKFSPGQIIIHEHDPSNRLYLILTGDVQIKKEAYSDPNHITVDLATLSAGQILGEMAFLDNAPRTASAVAITETTTLSWSIEDLEKSKSQGSELTKTLKNNIVFEITSRFRSTNTKYVESLKKQLHIAKDQIEFGRLFIVLIVILVLNSLLVLFISQGKSILDPYSLPFGWSYLLIIIFALLAYLRFDFSRLSEFGITLTNWKKSLMHGFAVGIILTGIVFGLFKGYVALGHEHKMHSDWIKAFFSLGIFNYFIHSFLQEFVARGFLLNSLRNFYRDQPTYFSILLSSFLFGAFHFTFGIVAAALTFLSGIIFGYLYVKDKNLLGVTIAHTLAGWAAFKMEII